MSILLFLMVTTSQKGDPASAPEPLSDLHVVEMSFVQMAFFELVLFVSDPTEHTTLINFPSWVEKLSASVKLDLREVHSRDWHTTTELLISNTN